MLTCVELEAGPPICSVDSVDSRVVNLDIELVYNPFSDCAYVACGMLQADQVSEALFQTSPGSGAAILALA